MILVLLKAVEVEEACGAEAVVREGVQDCGFAKSYFALSPN